MGVLSLLLSLGAVSCELLKVQDLLSPALSPAALLGPLPALAANQSVAAGDLDHAVSTMLYHRSKMNEFLCHNYLADEILHSLSPLESRSGEPAGFKTQEGETRSHAHDQLLTDPGSTAYKAWLQKSSQMEEMYGQDGHGVGGYETGDVTGYATMQSDKEDGYHYQQATDWSGGGGVSGWSEGGSHGWHGNSGAGLSGWEEHEAGKGLALKDLFDLALTALAFLAFGIFVLNLIMTCFAKPPNLTLTMTGNTTVAARRRKRESHNQLNELAFRVLTSVDRLLELQGQPDQTQDTCLQYTLCDNNKYSRALNDKNRIWLPVWSMGMSWVAGRQPGVSSLDHIRASVLGLGNAECTVLYPHCATRVPPSTTTPKSVSDHTPTRRTHQRVHHHRSHK